MTCAPRCCRDMWATPLNCSRFKMACKVIGSSFRLPPQQLQHGLLPCICAIASHCHLLIYRDIKINKGLHYQSP